MRARRRHDVHRDRPGPGPDRPDQAHRPRRRRPRDRRQGGRRPARRALRRRRRSRRLARVPSRPPLSPVRRPAHRAPRGTCVSPISPAASSSPASASSAPSATTRTPRGRTLSTAAPASTTITKFDPDRYTAPLGRRGQGLRRRRVDGRQGRPPQRAGHVVRRRGRQAGRRRRRPRDHRREPRGHRGRLRLRRRRPVADDRQLAVLDDKGPNRVAPTFIANGLVDCTSGMIAIETGAIGHNICVVTACSTGTNCVGEAAEIIRRGDVHTIITGSTRDAAARGRACRLRQHARPRSPRDGRAASPTCRGRSTATRDGFVLGEGAGGLILEDLEYAKARGAHIYAEVVATARRPTAGTWSSRSSAAPARRAPCRRRSSGAACRPTRST